MITVDTAAQRPTPNISEIFGEGGFDLLVEDMVRLSRIAKEETPGLPFRRLGIFDETRRGRRGVRG
jgi:hypothetical protein